MVGASAYLPVHPGALFCFMLVWRNDLASAEAGMEKAVNVSSVSCLDISTDDSWAVRCLQRPLVTDGCMLSSGEKERGTGTLRKPLPLGDWIGGAVLSQGLSQEPDECEGLQYTRDMVDVLCGASTQPQQAGLETSAVQALF